MHAAALKGGVESICLQQPRSEGGPEHMHAAALKGGVLNICMQQP